MPNKEPAKDELMIWTWGKERDFWSESTDGQGYFPAHAIYLS